MSNNTYRVTRKLSAILSADVKGYSVLMADDEVHTIETLKKYRKLMLDLINQHSGRVVDNPGDNLLAEFGSAVDAVEAAVQIQKRLERENTRFVKDSRLRFRIGINIGDIVQDGDRIYGEGVNIAARIEGLTDAGGVCVSRSTYDQIKNKLTYDYEYLGEYDVKNITELVRVYRVLFDADSQKPPVGQQLELPDKPSIAVLPFVNMSNDPEQEYFSDGMTDELIGDLAKINDIFVISRNSAFTYKGKSIKVQQIAHDLNVRYILEGSVQKSGNKVRIRAQLIDGKTDHHLWSESYDGVMDDIFELQDKITGSIVSALAVKLTSDEQVRISDKGTDNIMAYDTYLKGHEHFSQLTGENFLKAVEYFQQAIKIDPNFSRAYGSLGMTYFWMTTHDFPRQLGIKDPVTYATLKFKARHYAELAMTNPNDSAYRTLAAMDTHLRKYNLALDSAQKALALAPNDSRNHIPMVFVLNFIGRHEEALAHIDEAIKLDPILLDLKLGDKGKTYYLLGDYKKAVELIDKTLKLNPGLTVYAAYAAASYAFLDKQNEAKKAWKIFEENFPEGLAPTTKFLYWGFPFKDEKVFNRYVDGLVKAGFKGDPSDYYSVHRDSKLSGDQIKNLFYGNTANGFTDVGFEITLKISTNGEAELNFPKYGFGDRAKCYLENDQLCFKFENWFESIKFCTDFYINPKGSYINKDQYLILSDIGLWNLSGPE